MPKRPATPLPEKGRLRRRIGSMLKIGRTGAHLSQSEAARLLGLGDRSTIAKYETGEREATPAQLCRFGLLYNTAPGSYLQYPATAVDEIELEALVRSEIQFAKFLIEYAEAIQDPDARKEVIYGLRIAAQKFGYKPPAIIEEDEAESGGVH